MLSTIIPYMIEASSGYPNTSFGNGIGSKKKMQCHRDKCFLLRGVSTASIAVLKCKLNVVIVIDVIVVLIPKTHSHTRQRWRI